MGRQLSSLLSYIEDGEVDCGAADGRAPAAEGPNACRHSSGIAVAHLDAVHGHAQIGGGQLRPGGLMTLAMR